LRTLVSMDPPIALAKLRIELEQEMRQLLLMSDPKAERRPLSVRQLARELMKRGIIDDAVGEAVLSVSDVLNRAVHGAQIGEEDAERIIEGGIRLLDSLAEAFLRTNEPSEVQVISPKEASDAAGAKYQVTTIVPYLEKPEKRTYIVTQPQLDAMLEGYDEYAEFLVEVRQAE
jgi:hypothetical protein